MLPYLLWCIELNLQKRKRPTPGPQPSASVHNSGSCFVQQATLHSQKDGELKPGAKGLALTPEQWHVLAASLTELNKAVEEDSIGHTVNLASNRRVTVTSFKGSTNVDLREYYEKNGDLAPGKT